MHVSLELYQQVLLQIHCRRKEINLNGKINLTSMITVSVASKVSESTRVYFLQTPSMNLIKKQVYYILDIGSVSCSHTPYKFF
jgi:hypothetical protein